MNKIKLVYDVIRTMKDKEIIQGSFTAEGKKDQVPFINVKNQFQKNLANGELKATISTELNTEGKKVKNESSIELNSESRPGGLHPHFHQHMNHHHNHGGRNPHNFKERLTFLTFAFKMLDEMQVDEQADSILVSLNLSELPEEFKKTMQGKMEHHEFEEHHKHPFPMKDFVAMEKANILMKIQISKNKEVEKVTITVDGHKKSEPEGVHEINFSVDCGFIW